MIRNLLTKPVWVNTVMASLAVVPVAGWVALAANQTPEVGIGPASDVTVEEALAFDPFEVGGSESATSESSVLSTVGEQRSVEEVAVSSQADPSAGEYDVSVDDVVVEPVTAAVTTPTASVAVTQSVESVDKTATAAAVAVEDEVAGDTEATNPVVDGLNELVFGSENASTDTSTASDRRVTVIENPVANPVSSTTAGTFRVVEATESANSDSATQDGGSVIRVLPSVRRTGTVPADGIVAPSRPVSNSPFTPGL